MSEPERIRDILPRAMEAIAAKEGSMGVKQCRNDTEHGENCALDFGSKCFANVHAKRGNRDKCPHYREHWQDIVDQLRTALAGATQKLEECGGENMVATLASVVVERDRYREALVAANHMFDYTAPEVAHRIIQEAIEGGE